MQVTYEIRTQRNTVELLRERKEHEPAKLSN